MYAASSMYYCEDFFIIRMNIHIYLNSVIILQCHIFTL